MILSISGKINSGKDTVGKIIQVITSSPTFTDEAVLKFLDRELLNQKFEIKKWADAIKDMVCMMLGCTRVQLEDREFKEKELGEEWVKYSIEEDKGKISWKTLYFNSSEEAKKYIKKYHRFEQELKRISLTPRLLLQLLGTECGRNILHPNIWVNTLMSHYKPTDLSLMKLRRKGFTGGGLVYPNWIITDTRFPNELKAVHDRVGISIRVNRPILGDQDNVAAFKTKTNVFHESETALDNYEFDYTIDNNGSLLELIAEVRIILKQLKLC